MAENKTAVEWLVEQMFGEHTRAWQKQINQAKAMEKEQIIKAACYEPWIGDLPKSEGEHYYKENYESNS